MAKTSSITGKARGTMKDGKLRGRFLWLLEEMCRKCDVDVQAIDPTLDYYENKVEIEEQHRKKLFLKPGKRGPQEQQKEINGVVHSYEERLMNENMPRFLMKHSRKGGETANEEISRMAEEGSQG